MGTDRTDPPPGRAAPRRVGAGSTHAGTGASGNGRLAPKARRGLDSGGPAAAGEGTLDARLKLQLEDLVATMCKALNDAKRLMLLYALRDGARSVGDLCEVLGVPQSNASQHLAVLRERGLVVTDRQGNRVLYSLRYPALLDAVDVLRSVMAEELDRQHQLHDLPAAAGR